MSSSEALPRNEIASDVAFCHVSPLCILMMCSTWRRRILPVTLVLSETAGLVSCLVSPRRPFYEYMYLSFGSRLVL